MQIYFPLPKAFILSIRYSRHQAGVAGSAGRKSIKYVQILQADAQIKGMGGAGPGGGVL